MQQERITSHDLHDLATDTIKPVQRERVQQRVQTQQRQQNAQCDFMSNGTGSRLSHRHTCTKVAHNCMYLLNIWSVWLRTSLQTLSGPTIQQSSIYSNILIYLSIYQLCAQMVDSHLFLPRGAPNPSDQWVHASYSSWSWSTQTDPYRHHPTGTWCTLGLLAPSSPWLATTRLHSSLQTAVLL